MMKLEEMNHTLKAADGGQGVDVDDIMGQMKDGTTIIAMKYNGGILLGADGRSSSVSINLRLI